MLLNNFFYILRRFFEKNEHIIKIRAFFSKKRPYCAEIIFTPDDLIPDTSD